jgi:hypothetical protein
MCRSDIPLVMPDLIRIITATDPGLRNQSLERACAGLSADELLRECARLDEFRRRSENLYERVRALFFLYAIHRFPLPERLRTAPSMTGHQSPVPNHRSLIPFKGYEHLLQRRFEEAVDHFLAVQQAEGPSDPISSALAAAYHRLAFQTLADQAGIAAARRGRWNRPDSPRVHPRAHGSNALRLE